MLAIDSSDIAQNLEQSIMESERRLEEIQRKQGEWETEEQMVQEFDRVLEIDKDVIFRETGAWLLVGLNLSLLDEWMGHQREVKHRKLRPEATVIRLSHSKLEEVRSMVNRYRSHWELSRSVRALGRSLAEERLFALGDRFVKWNLLSAKEDVRYLTVHEVRQIVSGGCATNTCNNYALRARVRRTEMDQHAVDGLPRSSGGNQPPSFLGGRKGNVQDISWSLEVVANQMPECMHGHRKDLHISLTTVIQDRLDVIIIVLPAHTDHLHSFGDAEF